MEQDPPHQRCQGCQKGPDFRKALPRDHLCYQRFAKSILFLAPPLFYSPSHCLHFALPLAGGTDITTNLRLAAALNRARLAKMPKENIEGAFSKATKSKDAAEMEDQTYEGYGPGGVAMIMWAILEFFLIRRR